MTNAILRTRHVRICFTFGSWDNPVNARLRGCQRFDQTNVETNLGQPIIQVPCSDSPANNLHTFALKICCLKSVLNFEKINFRWKFIAKVIMPIYVFCLRKKYFLMVAYIRWTSISQQSTGGACLLTCATTDHYLSLQVGNPPQVRLFINSIKDYNSEMNTIFVINK